MNEVKIKIKLPEEITVHIPTFSDIAVEDVLSVLATTGKQHILRTIEDRLLKTFVEKHEKLIGKVVRDLMDEKEDEIKAILGLK